MHGVCSPCHSTSPTKQASRTVYSFRLRVQCFSTFVNDWRNGQGRTRSCLDATTIIFQGCSRYPAKTASMGLVEPDRWCLAQKSILQTCAAMVSLARFGGCRAFALFAFCAVSMPLPWHCFHWVSNRDQCVQHRGGLSKELKPLVTCVAWILSRFTSSLFIARSSLDVSEAPSSPYGMGRVREEFTHVRTHKLAAS